MFSSALSTRVGDQSAGVFLAADDDRCHLAARVGVKVAEGGGNVTSSHVAGPRRLKIVEI